MAAPETITGAQAKLLKSVEQTVVNTMTPMVAGLTTQNAAILAELKTITLVLDSVFSRLEVVEAATGANCNTGTLETKHVAEGGAAAPAAASAGSRRPKKAATPAAPPAVPATPAVPAVSVGAGAGAAADGGKRTANAKLWFRDNFAPNLEQYFKHYDTAETRASAVANSKAMASEKPDSEEYMKKLALYIWDSVLDEDQKRDVKLKRVVLEEAEARKRATTTPQLDTDFSA